MTPLASSVAERQRSPVFSLLVKQREHARPAKPDVARLHWQRRVSELVKQREHARPAKPDVALLHWQQRVSELVKRHDAHPEMQLGPLVTLNASPQHSQSPWPQPAKQLSNDQGMLAALAMQFLLLKQAASQQHLLKRVN
jgi:hypothetical protein